MDPGDSAPWPPYRAREAALCDLRKRLEGEPDSLVLRFELAGVLAALGRTLEARNVYLELLASDPSHGPALNQLGTLLYGAGYRTAARTAFAEAVARHPNDPPSRVNLGNVLHDAASSPPPASTLRPRCSSTPAIPTRIKAWPTPWPNWATTKVRGSIGVRGSKAVR